MSKIPRCWSFLRKSHFYNQEKKNGPQQRAYVNRLVLESFEHVVTFFFGVPRYFGRFLGVREPQVSPLESYILRIHTCKTDSFYLHRFSHISFESWRQGSLVMCEEVHSFDQDFLRCLIIINTGGKCIQQSFLFLPSSSSLTTFPRHLLSLTTCS